MHQYFSRLFAYNSWANLQFLSFLENNLVTNGKVFLLMSHILAAEEIWLCRINGNIPPNLTLWKELPLPGLLEKAEILRRTWNILFNHTDAIEPGKMVTYSNIKGDKFTTPLTDILAHVCNHGTYHRGQIANFIKMEAIDPPATDYIVYSRKVNQP